MRIFYSDYGTDPFRITRIEAVLRDLKVRGVDVCRTSRMPLDTVAFNLVLPNMILRSLKDVGVQLHPDIRPTERRLCLQAATYRYDYPRRSFEECYGAIYLYRQYIVHELEQFKPDLVVLWHQYNAYHYVIADWCREKNVPVMFGENGVLPGSWCFEFQGQMGESWIAHNPEAFKALSIDKVDRKLAVVYLKHAVEHQLNRKGKGMTLEEAGLEERLTSDPRRKIVYAGINDYKTGLQPFSRLRTLKHTGDFFSTEAGLEALLTMARKNDWHILYKAHPSIKHDSAGLDAYSDCLTVVDKRVDLIDLLKAADALATIVSQSAYMALIHDKPAVLMGRMQLSGSGLVEEAHYKSKLEHALKTALADTCSQDRQTMLRDHVARLIKYYLLSFDYGKPGLFRYDLSKLAETIIEEVQLKKRLSV